MPDPEPVEMTHGQNNNLSNFSTPLAIVSVLFFVISTVLICFCAYCVDFKKVLNFVCCCLPKKEKYSISTETAHIFANQFNEAMASYPMESTPPMWRNAVIVGTPPYRKLTTISRYRSDATDEELEMLRNCRTSNSSKTSVISAV